MDVETVELRRHPGVEVLAKRYRGSLMAVTYANRTQAVRRAQTLGPEWEVYHWGRPFFVGQPRGRASERRGKYASFDAWMRGVDQMVSRKLGVGVGDLPDMAFRDAYDDGVSPSRFFSGVVMPVIREEGGLF